MMKRLYIYLLLSYMFILVGCIKKIPRPTPVAGYVNVKMVISNGLSRNLTRTTDDDLFTEEYAIKSIRIITFHEGKLDRNYHLPKKESTTGVTQITMSVLRTTNLKVYIIANETTNLTSQLDVINTEVELEDIEYQMADYFTTVSPLNETAFSYDASQAVPTTPLFSYLPMSANGTINTVAGEDEIHKFYISRALARVDVWLRKKEKTQYNLTEANSILEYNTYGKGKLFNVNNNTLVATALDTKTVKAKKLEIPEAKGVPYNELVGVDGGYTRVFTFYTPERKNGENTRLQFTMKKLIYGPIDITGEVDNISVDLSPVVLINDENSKEITTITRNNVYSMYCSISARGSMLLVGCEIMPWKDVKIKVPSFD